jgi:LPS-assembly protein
MVAINRHLNTLIKQLLGASIVIAPTITFAETRAQQWLCKAVDGEWQCQQESINSTASLLAPAQGNPQSALNGKNILTGYSQWDWVAEAQLDDPSVCKTGCDGAYVAPPADWQEATQDPDGSPLRADAANSSMAGDTVELTGDVILSQGSRSIKASRAEFNRSTNALLLTDNIEAREPGLLLRAGNASINTETNLGHFDKALFVMHEQNFRGTADVIERSTASTLELKNGSITQCTPDDELWSIKSASILLDTEEGMGTAKHARLNVKDVPVLYIPYFSFPIDDRRKTGFLNPSFGSSNDNGFEVTAPYYFNIAPSFDATLAPHFIEKRGTMIEAELRHLNRFGLWQLAGSHLKDDQFTETPTPNEINDVPPQENRWIANLDHSGNVFGISTRIDYSKVSDEDFFSDLATDSLEVKRTSHLNQQISLGYDLDNWQIELTAQDHQTVDELLTSQYQLMPRFSVERNFTGASFEPDWQVAAEFTDFQHDESIADGGKFITGERTFAEAGFSYPMRWAAGFVIPTAKIRSISYKLDDVTAGGEDSPSATAPLATLDMGLIFERDFKLNDSNYLQTLEPRVYYLYSEFQEQDEAPDFDTRELNFSYSQLFRDNRFSGHDRLSDADQVSIGVTSRFINDSTGQELLTVSLGQIFYFEDRQIQINNANPTQSSSAIASEILYQPSEKLWLSNSLLWDSRENKINEGGLGLHYQTNGNSLYNLGYTYRRLGTTSPVTGRRDLSQIDTSMALALTDRWSLYGRQRYDIDEHSTLDQLAGLQYEDCCWMVRLLYQEGVQQQFRDELTGQLVVENDSAFILEFQLKGLGSLGNKAINLLNESILGYEDLD